MIITTQDTRISLAFRLAPSGVGMLVESVTPAAYPALLRYVESVRPIAREHCDDCGHAQPNVTTYYGQRLCPQCILTPGWADDYDPATDSIDGLDYGDYAFEAWRDRSLDA